MSNSLEEEDTVTDAAATNVPEKLGVIGKSSTDSH
jgi:hypothetical protein